MHINCGCVLIVCEAVVCGYTCVHMLSPGARGPRCQPWILNSPELSRYEKWTPQPIACDLVCVCVCVWRGWLMHTRWGQDIPINEPSSSGYVLQYSLKMYATKTLGWISWLTRNDNLHRNCKNPQPDSFRASHGSPLMKRTLYTNLRDRRVRTTWKALQRLSGEATEITTLCSVSWMIARPACVPT